MKRSVALLVALSACLVGRNARSEEARFDAQIFRPSAAPRDLVMVQKSEVIADRSPTVGFFLHYSLDPLALFLKDSEQTLDAVGGRLELIGLAGIGFFNWFDVTLAMPLILWQGGDNLRAIGSEGAVQSQALGDLRLSTKLVLPYFNRKAEIKRGFGMALTGNIGLPTGNQNAFAGDGAVTGGFGIIADYRWNFGLIVATNAGVWIRPNREFASVKIGDMGSFGVAAEMNVIQRWGLSVIGEVYGHATLTKFPDSARQVPAEALLGVRWQSKHGITITVGGAFGADCGFGVPAFRFFSQLTWQPKSSYEQEEITRLQQRDIDDPDGDGLIGKADRCPNDPGLPANLGCPDSDKDKDGLVDREDECPDEPAGKFGQKGCPMARIKGDEIVILDQVHFATDKDLILEESTPVLESVAQVLIDHPDLREVVIEGHTDVRAGDIYNMNLSSRRVTSVMNYLIQRGIDPSRLQAKGFGHSAPIYDDRQCLGTDEQLTDMCRRMTSANRRVVFRITRVGAAGPRPIAGAPDGSGAVLPGKETVLPTTGTLQNKERLPSSGVLNNGGVLTNDRVLLQPGEGKELKDAGKNGVLPKGTVVLPRANAPGSEKPAPEKPAPEKPAPEKPAPKK
jgi:outer membrane protein OmpA-like peptidoglycan-associated protein